MNIAIIGYGKMGKTIEGLLQKEPLQSKHQVGMRINSRNMEELTIDNLQKNKIDVAIEFTQPEAAVLNIEKCLYAGVPVVCGTTAWLKHLSQVAKLCEEKKGALFYASNFSIGVNIFFEINRRLAKLMNGRNDYHIQIDEIHHTQKLDAPSGTAITLAEAIVEENKSKTDWINTRSLNPEDLEIVSHRREDVKGTHLITYHSPIDTLEIKHTAHSREGFAQGAILAAEWLYGKQGIFTMKDMLCL